MASTNSADTQSNNVSLDPHISSDGRYVTFVSYATQLVANDTNQFADVFRKDLQTGATARVSVDASGTQANGESWGTAVSADGRYVTFVSTASNLVANDTNGVADIFRKDMTTGAIVRVSTDASGTQAAGANDNASISSDGRYITFESEAANLVTGDTNGVLDVFRKDMTTGAIVRVSTSSVGAQGTAAAGATETSISADGNIVTFVAYDGGLVAGDTNGVRDIFQKNLTTGATVLVSANAAGVAANLLSHTPAASSDGRYVVFMSQATNLIASDTNGVADIFRKDLVTGEVVLVSASAAGVQGNAASGTEAPSISADGRYVTFSSFSSNLVAGDTNGGEDIFRKDMVTGDIIRISVSGTGVEGGDQSGAPAMSSDGRYITFISGSENLVDGDANGWRDIFVVDTAASAGATLTGTSGIDVLIGSDLADTLSGNANNDYLQGGGGNDRLTGHAGADKLSGGSGADTFVFTTSSDGGDTITDFVAGTDKIEVSVAGFGGGLTAGGSVSLVSGAAPVATLATGQFLYNTTTGVLSWDVDGTGGTAAVVLATFTGAPALTASDFTVVASSSPVIIDLNGDGVHLTSGVSFDFNGDGVNDIGGWASSQDGFLALDRNGDGKISGISEISFTSDLPGAVSDLDGLKAFDTNGDGKLDANDARFGDFKIWQDVNGDGISEAGEVKSLSEAGIVSIDLTRTGDGVNQAAGAILGYATVTMADGSATQAADTQLTYATGAGDAQTTQIGGLTLEGDAFDFSAMASQPQSDQHASSGNDHSWMPNFAAAAGVEYQPGMHAEAGLPDFHAPDLHVGHELALDGVVVLGPNPLA